MNQETVFHLSKKKSSFNFLTIFLLLLQYFLLYLFRMVVFSIKTH